MRLVQVGEAETFSAREPTAKATRDGGWHSAASPGDCAKPAHVEREAVYIYIIGEIH